MFLYGSLENLHITLRGTDKMMKMEFCCEITVLLTLGSQASYVNGSCLSNRRVRKSYQSLPSLCKGHGRMDMPASSIPWYSGIASNIIWQPTDAKQRLFVVLGLHFGLTQNYYWTDVYYCATGSAPWIGS